MDGSTPYKDKSGKDIRLGDIVQHRLGGKGLPPKHGGPSTFRVVRPGKKLRLAPLDQDLAKNAGAELNERMAQSLIIVDRAH